MKKIILGILTVFLLTSAVVFAETDLFSQVAEDVVFIHITGKPDVNIQDAYDQVFNELKTNNLGNSISMMQFSQLKAEAAKKNGSYDADGNLALYCAKVTKGYFLKVFIDVAKQPKDKATFELYEPNTLKLITKVEVTNSFGFSLNASAKKLITNGIKQLSTEIQKNQPSLIKK